MARELIDRRATLKTEMALITASLDTLKDDAKDIEGQIMQIMVDSGLNIAACHPRWATLFSLFGRHTRLRGLHSPAFCIPVGSLHGVP